MLTIIGIILLVCGFSTIKENTGIGIGLLIFGAAFLNAAAAIH